MRLTTSITIILLVSTSLFAQETTDIESLGLPDEVKNEANPAVPKKVDTDLSLPGSNTSTSIAARAVPRESKNKKDNVGAILDFEGEIIEGERRRPDLFLQISIDNIKFDSLIYNREDFNDYLEVDRKSRTRFLKMK